MRCAFLSFLLVVEAFLSEPDQFLSKARETILRNKTIFEFEGTTYQLIQRKGGWETVETRTHSTSTMNPTSTAGLLTTSVLLTTVTSVIGGYFDEDTPAAERIKVGERLANKLCERSDSKECKSLLDRYWIPPLGEDNVKPTIVAPKVKDPCANESVDCFNWGSFRSQILFPFVNQIQSNKDSLDKFPDDKLDDALFSAKEFRQWFEVMNLPDDRQSISEITAATLGLKIVTACLSQIRLARIEQFEQSGPGWVELASLPGCVVLLIYLALSSYQIKSYWKKRNERNDEDRTTKILEILKRQHNTTQEQEPLRGNALLDQRYLNLN